MLDEDDSGSISLKELEFTLRWVRSCEMCQKLRTEASRRSIKLADSNAPVDRKGKREEEEKVSAIGTSQQMPRVFASRGGAGLLI